MKKVLLSIVIVAFILRIVGIQYGLPLQFVGDEASLVGGALKMLEIRTVIPALHPEEFRLLYYPPVIPYLYLLAIVPTLAVKFFLTSNSSLEALRQAVVLDPTPAWLASRFVSALSGTGVVLLLYFLGRKLFGELAGFFAASFVATSFLAVQLSHFARHWMLATFFTYLVIAFGILIYLQAGRRAYLWAGYAAGMAFGVSFITAVGVIVPALAHALAHGKRTVRWEHLKNLLLGGLIFTAIAAIMALLNYPEFHRIVFGEDSTLQVAKSLPGALAAVGESALAFFRYEPILAILGLLGAGMLAMSSRKLFILFASFPLLYWLTLYLFFHFEPRYNILLVPWVALLAALAASWFWTRPVQTHRTVSRVAIVILLLLPAAVSAYYDYVLLKPDTRIQARAWIERHLPTEATIILYAASLELTPNKAAIEERFARYPYTIRTRDRILRQLDSSHYPFPAYRILNLRQLEARDQLEFQQLGEKKFAYAVIERFPRESLPALLQGLSASGTVIAQFSAQSGTGDDFNGNFEELVFSIFKYKNFGPDVVVVKL